MKIGVISDTHDRLPSIEKALFIFIEHQVSFIIHCGDWTQRETVRFFSLKAAEKNLLVKGVLGNRDAQEVLSIYNASLDNPIELPEDLEQLLLTIGRRKAAVYHGHHKPTLRKLLQDPELEIVFTGHSHKPRIDYLQDKLVINPGSTAFSIPRRREPRSVALYDDHTHTAELIYFQP